MRNEDVLRKTWTSEWLQYIYKKTYSTLRNIGQNVAIIGALFVCFYIFFYCEECRGFLILCVRDLKFHQIDRKEPQISSQMWLELQIPKNFGIQILDCGISALMEV